MRHQLYLSMAWEWLWGARTRPQALARAWWWMLVTAALLWAPYKWVVMGALVALVRAVLRVATSGRTPQ